MIIYATPSNYYRKFSKNKLQFQPVFHVYSSDVTIFRQILNISNLHPALKYVIVGFLTDNVDLGKFTDTALKVLENP